ncbi:MAG: potassium transporter TrkG [Spirochaetales bacterium]|nr:potassium transporter TrkG [Spirochaetales bacterium]
MLPALIILVTGFSIFIASDKSFKIISYKTGNRQIIAILFLSWLVFILAGTLPFLISKTNLSFVDALFESTSGYTTTGSSVLNNIGQLPESIIFWRSLTQWTGGLATIVTITTFFPILDIGGYQLFSLGKRPVFNTRLFILRISLIYVFMTVIQTTILYMEGMGLFNSLCYSFGTVSTGCFSPGDMNISSFSPLVPSTLAFFMFLSGVSYLFYYRLVYKKLKFKKIDEELKVYIILILIGVLLVIWGMHGTHPEDGLLETTRKALYQVISVVSSSGYLIADYSIFPDIILTVLFFYLFIGACSNTSTGGIKISRVIVLFRNIWLQFKNPNSPENTSEIKYNGHVIDTKTNLSVLGFISLFGTTFVFGAIAMSFFGYGLKESAFLSISALSTLGHNLDLSQLPDAGKIILELLMILGKLEIYPLLIMFIPQFYKKDQLINNESHAEK